VTAFSFLQSFDRRVFYASQIITRILTFSESLFRHREKPWKKMLNNPENIWFSTLGKAGGLPRLSGCSELYLVLE
jgi:hypothetical protein